MAVDLVEKKDVGLMQKTIEARCCDFRKRYGEILLYYENPQQVVLGGGIRKELLLYPRYWKVRGETNHESNHDGHPIDVLREASKFLDPNEKFYGFLTFEACIYGLERYKVLDNTELLARFVIPEQKEVFEKININKEGNRLFTLATAQENMIFCREVSERLDTTINNILAKADSQKEDERFKKSIERAIDLIRKKVLNKIIISRKVTFNFSTEELFNLFRIYYDINRSNYNFFFQFPDIAVLGCSPEVMLDVKDREVIVNPIAGTRARGRNPSKDLQFIHELFYNRKETWEHTISVQAAWDELSLVCRQDSIRINRFMDLLQLSRIQHISSIIGGEINNKYDQFDVMKRVLPAITVSGVPKKKAIEVISDLEGENRGLYAGASGCFDRDSCNLVVNIRILVGSNGNLRLQSGAGIMEESNIEEELLESKNKMSAALEAYCRWQKLKGVSC